MISGNIESVSWAVIIQLTQDLLGFNYSVGVSLLKSQAAERIAQFEGLTKGGQEFRLLLF
ncbi:hypothetical protein [Nostoc sp.]|uniref:hypothetical protein n=1 Tax=Nostoc sp. TaxID=1180 RepID=UPI002FF8FABA